MSSPDLQHLSRLHQDLRKLETRISRLIPVFFDRNAITRGTVYELRRRCGKPSCRCATKGELHPVTVISWNEDGRQRLRSLKKHEVAELRRLTARYRRFRQARSELAKRHAEMIEIIDEIEKALRKDV